MQDRVAKAPPHSFTPAPGKARHDGWSPERQRRFIVELAATRSVTRACAVVGMSATTAYALRRRAGAASFAAAWDAALAFVPDPGRPRSPRAVQRLARIQRRVDRAPIHGKTNEVSETNAPHIQSFWRRIFASFASFEIVPGRRVGLCGTQ